MNDWVVLITMQIGYRVEETRQKFNKWSRCDAAMLHVPPMMAVCKFMSSFCITSHMSKSPSEVVGVIKRADKFYFFQEALKHC